MTKITYIWHDCFMVVTESFQLVFDYWTDPTLDNKGNELPQFIKDADKALPIYFLVSHHHKDHFNKLIFEWRSLFKSVKFIISKDVERHIAYMLRPTSTFTGKRPDSESIVILKPGEIFTDSLLKIEAFGSTDIGNSYYLSSRSSSTSFFHAGDLNAWIWKDESTVAEVNEAISKYENVLDEISASHPEIDYVMFPVDSRIGTDYFTGASMFVSRINVKHFFPMHFGLGDTPDIQKKYMYDACMIDNYANRERGEYICLTSPYSTFVKF